MRSNGAMKIGRFRVIDLAALVAGAGAIAAITGAYEGLYNADLLLATFVAVGCVSVMGSGLLRKVDRPFYSGLAIFAVVYLVVNLVPGNFNSPVDRHRHSEIGLAFGFFTGIVSYWVTPRRSTSAPKAGAGSSSEA
jgi:hypothetical protein